MIQEGCRGVYFFKQRWLSQDEIYLIFTAVSLPLQLWMWYNLLIVYPAYQFRLAAWDLVGFIAYPLAFVLLESLLVFGGVAMLAFFAPLSWRGDRRVAGAAVLVFAAAFWSILVHLNYETVIEWSGKQMMVWLLLALTSIALLIWATVRSPQLAKNLTDFLERAEVLAAFYLVIGLLSALIVGFRNLLGCM